MALANMRSYDTPRGTGVPSSSRAGHGGHRPGGAAARARARGRGVARRRRPRARRRVAQEHGLAAADRARAPRARRAGGRPRALPGRARAPALRAPRPRRPQPGRARAAAAARAGRGQRRDDQPRRRRAARRRAPRAGRQPALPGRGPVGRPARPLPRHGGRQGARRLRRRRAPARPARAADVADGRRPGALRRRARAGAARAPRHRRRRARVGPERDGLPRLRHLRQRGRRARHLRPHPAAPADADRRAGTDPHQAGPGALGAARSSSRGSARGMTHDEILKLLYDETLVGNAPAVKQGVEQGLEDGMDPERMLYDALIPSLEEVGARFERGDYFVPEMLIAARAMQGALDILRPLLAATGAKPIGRFLMGTVKGDVHDIGKNLCNIMLEGAGFEVIDLGVNVPPEKFVDQINEHEPDIVGFSAFLTTTMPMFKANINALEKGGIRENVIVGGAPVTQEYADAVGADGYSADASSAVKLAKDLIERRRSAVPA